MMTFNERLSKALLFNTEIDIKFIYSEINLFKSKYDLLLSPSIWEEEELDIRINEFDLLLTFYESLYELTAQAQLKNELKLWPNDQRPHSLGFIYIFRFLIQDLICLRNLCSMKYENQFNALFRNLIEKYRILFLLVYDYEFSKEYLFNDNSLESKERFYKLTRPSKIKNRIEKILENIINERKGKAADRLNRDVFELLTGDILEDVYSFSSIFTHSKDGQEFLKYYNENGKFNLSLRSNHSNYYLSRIDYCIEFILLIYPYIYSTLDNKIKLDEKQSIFASTILEYYGVLIEIKYQ